MRAQFRQCAPSWQILSPRQCILYKEKKLMVTSSKYKSYAKWWIEHIFLKIDLICLLPPFWTWLAGRWHRGKRRPMSWTDVWVQILVCPLSAICTCTDYAPRLNFLVSKMTITIFTKYSSTMTSTLGVEYPTRVEI